jgi:CHAT domain-containing protein/Flp pilus assembly protein TadD
MTTLRRHQSLFLGILLGALVCPPTWSLTQSSNDERALKALQAKGNSQSNAGQYQEAISSYSKALELARQIYGPDHVQTTPLLNNLAAMHWNLGQFAEAEPLFRRCLAIQEKHLGENHAEVARTLSNLAALYGTLGQQEKAEPLLLRSLKIREARIGEDPLAVSETLNNLALTYVEMGRYAKAEPLYRRALALRETKLGKEDPEVAFSVGNLAQLYRLTGRYAEAEPLFRRSLEIYETRLGKDHPQVADALSGLGNLYHSWGQDAKAEPSYLRSLEISEARLGKDHPNVAQVLSDLAALYATTGKEEKAESLLRRSLAIREAKLGKDHPEVAATLNNLGGVCHGLGKNSEAEQYHRRSLAMKEARLGKDHPDLAYSVHNLAVLEAVQGRWDEASRDTDRLRRLIRRHVALVLPGLSESEQQSFLQNTAINHSGLGPSLAVARPKDADLAVLSAGWVVNAKGLAQQTLAERALLAKDRANPRAAEVIQQLEAVRTRLAGLTYRSPPPGQEGHFRQERAQLVEKEQTWARQLGELVDRPFRTDPWINLEEVRQALPIGAVLIEINRFRTVDFMEGRFQKAHYAAWIIPAAGKGEIRLVDLGEAEPIEQAVQGARKALQQAPEQIREAGEPNAEKQLRPALEILSQLVLRPLLPHVAEAKHWIISPDADLWLVPWAALPIPEGGYAIEKCQISYIISGRDLVSTPVKIEKGRPTVFADPDFDLGVAVARAETRSLVNEAGALPELRGLSRPGSLPRVPPLPGTGVEAKAIQPNLQLYAGHEPRLFLREQALEGVFKALHSPKVLVLSTHGFFLENQNVAIPERIGIEENRPALDRDGKPLENPLLRCGLLLAGCNNRDQARNPDDEDGVLTGLEIVGTDLRGCELVVLSACETGVGDVRNGEGVAGLRQAFQLAGAQTIVATLWQVPDRQSAQLISSFFANLAAGQSKADALRNAQLKLIAARREQSAAAHPFFWAAYTVTGIR